MSTDPVPVPEAAVEAAKKAYAEAESAPNLVHCERCKGTGYHHGFGEDGHDPDWCRDCGGGGFALAAGEEDRPLRSALAAALPHLGPEHQFAARFARLMGIVTRLRWTDYGVPSRESEAAKAALDDLCEFLFQDGIDKALPPPPPSSKEDRT